MTLKRENQDGGPGSLPLAFSNFGEVGYQALARSVNGLAERKKKGEEKRLP
jgi:hypothetical protein